MHTAVLCTLRVCCSCQQVQGAAWQCMQTEVRSHLLEGCGTIWSDDGVHSSAPKAGVQVPLHESCHTSGVFTYTCQQQANMHTPGCNHLSIDARIVLARSKSHAN